MRAQPPTKLKLADQCADPVRWKDAPLARELFVLNNLMMRVGDRLVADLGLTASRWQLLGALETYPDPPSLTELTSDGLLTLQNVSRMVAAMEQAGLVKRFQKPKGGRAVYVRVTARGEAVRKEACSRAGRFADALVAGLRESDIASMQDRLDGMIRGMEHLEHVLGKETAPEPSGRSRKAPATKRRATGQNRRSNLP